MTELIIQRRSVAYRSYAGFSLAGVIVGCVAGAVA